MHAAQVIRDVNEEAVLADQVGAHFFGVGEHHRADFAVSAPEVVPAADWKAAADFDRFYYALVARLANQHAAPSWKPGSKLRR